MPDVSVSFGAQDEGVALAARRLSSELAVAERAGAKLSGTGKAASKSLEMIGKSIAGPVAGLARFGPAGAVLAVLAGGWTAAAHASATYAKVDKETQLALDTTAKKAELMWAKLGHQLGGDISSPLKSVAATISDLLGNDPELQAKFAAQEEKQARRRQDLALARDDNERQFLQTLQEEEDAYEKIVELHKVLLQSGAITGPQFRNLQQIDREAHDKRMQAALDKNSSAEAKRIADQAKADDQARDAMQDQMRAAYEKEKADRQSLDDATAEAHIDELRAKGKDKLAQQEQIRLDTLRKIRDIEARDGATDEEKRRAIEAVNNAQDAQLKALDVTKTSGRFTGSQIIGSGLFSAGLGRQVFGPSGPAAPNKPSDDIKKSMKEQTDLLKRIEANTRSGAVLS